MYGILTEDGYVKLLEDDPDPSDPPPEVDSMGWSEPGWVGTAKRPASSSRSAGTTAQKDGDEVFLAADLSGLLEILHGGATITAAAATCDGATVGDCATNPADWNSQAAATAVGAWFTDLAVGSWTVTFDVVLSDGSRHEIPAGLVVTA